MLLDSMAINVLLSEDIFMFPDKECVKQLAEAFESNRGST